MKDHYYCIVLSEVKSLLLQYFNCWAVITLADLNLCPDIENFSLTMFLSQF